MKSNVTDIPCSDCIWYYEEMGVCHNNRYLCRRTYKRGNDKTTK